MKRSVLLFCCCVLFFCNIGLAKHIKGGWIQYEYVSAASSTTSTYKITVYVFKNCSESGPMPSALGIYDAVTYANVKTITGTTNSYTLISTPTKSSFDPCLSNPPTICYQFYTYSTTVTLDNSTNGYIIVAQDANRITGLINITNSVSTGISFIATIPGILNSVDYHVNSNPYFKFTDTAIICYNSKFTYQFAATDADGDSLTYSFGDGINGTQALSAPPYSALTYNSGYSGTQPLGSNVTIDAVTGLISGVAPSATGEYVIAVYVSEWRSGVKINSTKKELQIIVGDCSLSAASLKTSYINCGTYTFSFQNETTASNITSYLWNFGDNNTSTGATPTYTYKDTGTYTLKLKVSNSGGCEDSTSSKVKVYPGFTPYFTKAGSCYLSPFQFTDKSYAKYGVINSWVWDFGDATVSTDTSSSQNPSYTYSAPGSYPVVLNITSSKGCSGSYVDTVIANGKPTMYLPFTDTLICSVDSVPLIIQTSGTTINWSPNYNIINPATVNPIVYPKDTTVYKVVVQDKGCIDSATVTVNVLQYITVKFASSDTAICETDSIQLKPISYALSYLWTEAPTINSLNSYTVKNPMAAPGETTTYYVRANLGYCQDSTKIKVYVAPYPKVTVGADTSICFGTRAQLHASITANSFSWSPTNSLYNSKSLTPLAVPGKTTQYILTVKDTSYCPKTVSDSVTVNVIPIVTINAGNDTTVAIGQPLQFNVSGDSSMSFVWLPATDLSNAFIYNPIGKYSSSDPDSILYTVKATTKEGCVGTDNILVKILKMAPDILVPSGFTPNNDGLNDILKPVLIGIVKFDYFNIYNRWGQMIFSTSQTEKGWDGTINGSGQNSGTYVYMTQGTDYLGNTIFRKGTVVLIR